jgi:2-hydroxyglutarate dehydrogenase
LRFDVTIVGGGIVGCATARELKIKRPDLRVALIEKEERLAFHQSGRNSGVLHAGIYYQPGSLKAKLCVQGWYLYCYTYLNILGIDLAYQYLDEKKIPYKQCGKLIVAVDNSEVNQLEALFKRAQQNSCKRIELVGPERIREIQPHCRVNSIF